MINQTETKSKPTIKVYVIDSVKAGSLQHESLIKFQKVQCENFPTVIAIRINEKTPQVVQALALENIYPLDPASFDSELQKVRVAFDILLALWFLNSKQYFLGLLRLNGYLQYGETSKRVIIKPYLATPVEGFQFPEPNKDKTVARNGIELCFDFKKIPQALDVWKWAVFTASLLFQFQLDRYIEKALACEKIAQFQPQIAMKNTFIGSSELHKCLTLCLNPDPQKRPTFQDLSLTFEKILTNSIPINQNSLSLCRQLYEKKQQSAKSQANIEITQSVLLTEELKKKLNKCYLQYGLKMAKSYKPLYRATRFQFNTRVFYEMCSGKGRLLFVIDTEDSGIICCYIEPTIILCEGSGFTGEFIPDASQKSFIYSTKNQQSYKLQNKQKAYRAVPGRGPIIGDSDLILTSSRCTNWCNFPRSYQAGKHKILTGKQFAIHNYDVYTVTF